jgi:parvulin-like peptidyl-prolyl isomerase
MGLKGVWLMKARIALLLLMAALLLVSCSKTKDEMPVAKVNDRVITLAEFERIYNMMDPRYLPEGEGFEKHKAFLETMIDKEIMALKADELGYDKNKSVQQGMEAFRRLGLQAAYLKFRVADEVEITEKMLRDYYDMMGTTVTMKQILCDTEEQAQKAYDLLKEGNDFESVCQQYSRGPDAEEGGKTMTATFGRFMPELQTPIFALPVGGITEPLESPYGYFVVKVLKKDRAKPAQSFEAAKSDIEPIVRSLEERAKMNEISEKIREKAGTTWYPESMQIIFDALPPDRPLTNPPRREDEKYPLLKFAEEDMGKPVLTYKDKVFTIEDFSNLYDRTSFFERPKREFRLGGIKGFLMKLTMNELVMDEMDASGIENHPELKRILDTKTEELMVTMMFEDLVTKEVNINRQDIQNYYKDNLENYKFPEQRRFGIIVANDQETAQEAYDKLIAGMPLPRVAQFYSIDDQSRSNLGETDFMVKGGQPEFDDVGFRLENIGDISKPFETSRGWVVLKLIEKAPERVRSLQEVQNAIEADLRTLKNDARLKELMTKWKEDITIEIIEPNLRKAEVDDSETRSRKK